MLLYSFMGWTFFKPYLPFELWDYMGSFIRKDLTFILGFMLTIRLVLAIFIVFDVVKTKDVIKLKGKGIC